MSNVYTNGVIYWIMVARNVYGFDMQKRDSATLYHGTVDFDLDDREWERITLSDKLFHVAKSTPPALVYPWRPIPHIFLPYSGSAVYFSSSYFPSIEEYLKPEPYRFTQRRWLFVDLPGPDGSIPPKTEKILSRWGDYDRPRTYLREGQSRDLVEWRPAQIIGLCERKEKDLGEMIVSRAHSFLVEADAELRLKALEIVDPSLLDTSPAVMIESSSYGHYSIFFLSNELAEHFRSHTHPDHFSWFPIYREG